LGIHCCKVNHIEGLTFSSPPVVTTSNGVGGHPILMGDIWYVHG